MSVLRALLSQLPRNAQGAISNLKVHIGGGANDKVIY